MKLPRVVLTIKLYISSISKATSVVSSHTKHSSLKSGERYFKNQLHLFFVIFENSHVFQLYKGHIVFIWWISLKQYFVTQLSGPHQLSSIKAYALQFTRKAVAQASRSAWEVCINLNDHLRCQQRFHFQIIIAKIVFLTFSFSRFLIKMIRSAGTQLMEIPPSLLFWKNQIN